MTSFYVLGTDMGLHTLAEECDSSANHPERHPVTCRCANSSREVCLRSFALVQQLGHASCADGITAITCNISVHL